MFEAQTEKWQLAGEDQMWSTSAGFFDYDNDGDLDIITNEFGDVPQVLESNLDEQLKERLNFIKIKLVGSISNRDALGARVVISAHDKELTQINDGQSGYLSQSSMPLYFGLGDTKKIAYIDVIWPNGKTQRIKENISINTLIKIIEPTDE